MNHRVSAVERSIDRGLGITLYPKHSKDFSGQWFETKGSLLIEVCRQIGIVPCDRLKSADDDAGDVGGALVRWSSLLDCARRAVQIDISRDGGESAQVVRLPRDRAHDVPPPSALIAVALSASRRFVSFSAARARSYNSFLAALRPTLRNCFNDGSWYVKK